MSSVPAAPERRLRLRRQRGNELRHEFLPRAVSLHRTSERSGGRQDLAASQQRQDDVVVESQLERRILVIDRPGMRDARREHVDGAIAVYCALTSRISIT